MSKFIPRFKVQSEMLRQQCVKALEKAKLDKQIADTKAKIEKEIDNGTTKLPEETV